jgi:hypothetical protein
VDDGRAYQTCEILGVFHAMVTIPSSLGFILIWEFGWLEYGDGCAIRVRLDCCDF